MKRLFTKEGEKIVSCLWPDDQNPEGWVSDPEELKKEKPAPKKRGRPKKVENDG